MFTVTTFDQWTDSVGRLLDTGVSRSSAVLFMVSYIVVRESPLALALCEGWRWGVEA